MEYKKIVLLDSAFPAKKAEGSLKKHMKYFLGIFVAMALFSPISRIHAYGGGFSFPPGYFGSPVTLKCHLEQRSLGYRTVLVHKCEAVQDVAFKDRLRAFVERVRSGGYQN